VADLTTMTLPVLPLRNGVVFPHMVVTVGIESDEARRAIAAAESAGGRLLLVPQLDDTFASVGTIASIQRVTRDNGVSALIAGMTRARIGAGRAGSGDVLWVDAEPIAEEDPGLREEMAEYRAVVSEILQHRGVGPIAERILDVDDPGQLADLAVYSPDLSLEQKVEVLETIDVRERLAKVQRWMDEVLADLMLRRRVRDEATERIDKTQREYMLRQQLEAIRSELGESDGNVTSDYRKRLAGTDLPEAVAEAVTPEPEHGWIRTWLDTVFELPWALRTDDHLDLAPPAEPCSTPTTPASTR
jgi:ATP-dependent Lon protease